MVFLDSKDQEIRLGDRVRIIAGAGIGSEGEVIGLRVGDSIVYVVRDETLDDREAPFKKYGYNLLVLGDPDLRVDIGL